MPRKKVSQAEWGISAFYKRDIIQLQKKWPEDLGMTLEELESAIVTLGFIACFPKFEKLSQDRFWELYAAHPDFVLAVLQEYRQLYCNSKKFKGAGRFVRKAIFDEKPSLRKCVKYYLRTTDEIWVLRDGKGVRIPVSKATDGEIALVFQKLWSVKYISTDVIKKVRQEIAKEDGCEKKKP